jgi:hypothetical protein
MELPSSVLEYFASVDKLFVSEQSEYHAISHARSFSSSQEAVRE